MQWELLFFLHSFLLGICIYVIYDLFKSIRRVWEHRGSIVAIEDFVFWVCCGLYVFIYLYKRNYGILRIYEVTAMLLGSVIYGCFVSTYFEKLLTWILRKFRYMMEIPIKFIKKMIKGLKKTMLRVRILIRKFWNRIEVDRDDRDEKTKKKEAGPKKRSRKHKKKYKQEGEISHHQGGKAT